MVVAKSVRRQTILETYQETFPVRTPGAIQPHGVLLAINPTSWVIEQVSQNTRQHLGHSPEQILGQPLKRIFSANQIGRLQANLAQRREGLNPLPLSLSLKGKKRYFDSLVHQTQAAIILELEPAPHKSETRFLDFHSRVSETLAQMQQVTNLPDFLHLVTDEIRNLSGFDRVMVYRFDQDSAGIVEAESKTDELPPYLGLHFPSIDIPEPARDLFKDNPLRLIPTIDYEPVPLITAPGLAAAPPLDLGRSILRQASPCHLQYLKNMGVAATMIMPLIKDGQLWGLIACHHQTPKSIFHETRTACEFLGQVMCLELSSKVNYSELKYEKQLQALLSDFIETISQADTLKTALVDPGPRLLPLVGAHGAAVCLEGQITLIGTTPDLAQVRDLLTWVTPQAEENIFYTDALAEQYPPAEGFQPIASGMLLLQISKVRDYAILWFRPEVVQTVDWAGAPQAEIEKHADGSLELSPRKSFQIWQETVHHCSLPWQACEIKIALDLRSSLVGIVLNKADELAELNVELQRSNQELDAFAYAASHDLQEPLRGIHNYASLLLKDSANVLDSAATERLETMMRLTQRMQTLIESLLHFSRLGQAELQLQTIDLNQLLEQVIQLIQVNRRDTDFEVRLPRPLPTVKGDPVLLEEVFSNLISNALKYNTQPNKWVEIGYLISQDSEYSSLSTKPSLAGQTVYYVKDNGIGIRERHLEKVFRLFKRLHGRDKYGGGTGAGLTITRKIVERHSGQIWVESAYGQGATFYFTLSL